MCYRLTPIGAYFSTTCCYSEQSLFAVFSRARRAGHLETNTIIIKRLQSADDLGQLVFLWSILNSFGGAFVAVWGGGR